MLNRIMDLWCNAMVVLTCVVIVSGIGRCAWAALVMARDAMAGAKNTRGTGG